MYAEIKMVQLWDALGVQQQYTSRKWENGQTNKNHGQINLIDDNRKHWAPTTVSCFFGGKARRAVPHYLSAIIHRYLQYQLVQCTATSERNKCIHLETWFKTLFKIHAGNAM